MLKDYERKIRRIVAQQSRTSSRKNLNGRAPNDWNNLSDDVMPAETLGVFKAKIDKPGKEDRNTFIVVRENTSCRKISV